MKSYGFRIVFLTILLAVFGFAGCAHRKASQVGIASYYGKKFHKKQTASGARFNMYAMTAAHPWLPFGTRIRVTNLQNGKSVIVTINDRGPFIKKRVIDLSYAAAKKLGFLDQGTTRVRIEPLD